MHYSGRRDAVRESLKTLDGRVVPGVHIYDIDGEVPNTSQLTKCVAIGEGLDPGLAVSAVFKNDLRHLVQADSLDLTRELEISARMISDPDGFLREPLRVLTGESAAEALDQGSQSVFLNSIKDADVREDILESIRQYLKSVPKMTTIRDSALIIANELLMNIMIDAPKYFQRTTGADPGVRERRLFAAYTEKFFFIGTEDAYGSLDVGKVLRRLHECYSDGLALANMNPGEGAGLGCRMMYELSHTLVMAVEGGKRTVFCCILPLGLSFRRQENLPKNIHILRK